MKLMKEWNSTDHVYARMDENLCIRLLTYYSIFKLEPVLDWLYTEVWNKKAIIDYFS